ncbi:hypothetical protein LCGC14_0387990 [marine sediment metagenome]|uniref:IstB-like ATP-binding domain-containing protein n=1 Tax=marine sediment metagenome TaxID=412755 RepID=A0A0F9TIL4_9ZZZZ
MKTLKTDSPNPLTEPFFDCPLCEDAGFVHPLKEDGKPDFSRVVPCKCKVKQLAEEARERRLRQCSLPHGTEGWTFDNFKVNKQWPTLKEAKDAALSLAEETSDFRWLILLSKTDRGKSHLAVAICRQWLERGKPAAYVFVPTMLDELRGGYDDHSYDRKLQYLKDVELLVLDDLGAQYVKNPNEPSWANERLVMIINHRLEEGLHMVVTTNKDLSNLPGDDEHRMGSRLLRFPGSKRIVIEAPEYRLEVSK